MDAGTVHQGAQTPVEQQGCKLEGYQPCDLRLSHLDASRAQRRLEGDRCNKIAISTSFETFASSSNIRSAELCDGPHIDAHCHCGSDTEWPIKLVKIWSCTLEVAFSSVLVAFCAHMLNCEKLLTTDN
jgi:hypothetical protein